MFRLGEEEDLDMSMLFIHGCNGDDMRKVFKSMSTFSQDKYPQNIESACNIYHTQYSKTDESNNNGNEGNDKGNDKNKNYDNDDKKKYDIISTHILMDSDASILAAD